ncbi:MAG: Ribosome hibernation promotion factor [Fimbriimonadaceae bacterium]|nr:Ribosome hibernation promotion factor [Fimbriimonadaceae bacterium]
MEVSVRNAEGNLSQHDKDYAAKKLGRLDRYFNQVKKVEMVHREDKLNHHVEITLLADGFTVRAEEEDQSVVAAIDKVSDKLENRLRRLKGRLTKAHRRKGVSLPPAMAEEDHEEDHHIDIRSRKHFLIKPMSLDEAALQLDMIEEPFYLFRNEDTGLVEALYKRKDGKYDLMQPEM